MNDGWMLVDREVLLVEMQQVFDARTAGVMLHVLDRVAAMDLPARTKGKKPKATNSEHDFPRYPNLVQDLEIVRRRALAYHRAPEIHHSDQGVQYASTAYTQLLQDVKCPDQHG